MNFMSNLKCAIIDWISGNSISYKEEIIVYDKIINLIENLDNELEILINKSTLADKWALIDFQNAIYTLPLLKRLIKETMTKSQNCSNEEMNNLLNYVIKLQKIYDNWEEKIKKRIIKIAPQKEEFQEIYYILIELRKILSSHMNLEAISQSDYLNDSVFPSYSNILKLKINIAKRKIIILPYLSEIDYNKGR